MQNPQALRARILKGINFPNEDILTAKKGRKPSRILASIILGRDFLKREGRWVVANGERINAWKDNWLCSRNNLRHLNNPSQPMVSELMDHSQRKWDVEKIRDILPSNYAIQAIQTPISWGQSLNPISIIHQTEAQKTEYYNTVAKELNQAGGIRSTLTRNVRAPTPWRPPRPGTLKCNVDASWEPQKHFAAIAVIIRDSSDNLRVTSACREEEKVGEIEVIIQDILTLKTSFQQCGFTWSPRQGNEVANFLARASVRGTLPVDWIFNPHPPLLRLIQKELQPNSR
ncbi:Reverse transcriptase-like [Sesbania bispinosa]|nr:Reverse transcriptase-like [Sesbania bispinosa]